VIRTLTRHCIPITIILPATPAPRRRRWSGHHPHRHSAFKKTYICRRFAEARREPHATRSEIPPLLLNAVQYSDETAALLYRKVDLPLTNPFEIEPSCERSHLYHVFAHAWARFTVADNIAHIRLERPPVVLPAFQIAHLCHGYSSGAVMALMDRRTCVRPSREV